MCFLGHMLGYYIPLVMFSGHVICELHQVNKHQYIFSSHPQLFR